MRIHPEPVNHPVPLDRQDDPPIERPPGIADHPDLGRVHTFPPGFFFLENGVYVPVSQRFSAVLSSNNWILGKFQGGTIHPIYNHRHHIVRVHLYSEHALELRPEEIHLMRFNQPYRAFNNNAEESATSAGNQRRNN